MPAFETKKMFPWNQLVFESNCWILSTFAARQKSVCWNVDKLSEQLSRLHCVTYLPFTFLFNTMVQRQSGGLVRFSLSILLSLSFSSCLRCRRCRVCERWPSVTFCIHMIASYQNECVEHSPPLSDLLLCGVLWSRNDCGGSTEQLKPSLSASWA